MSTSLIRLGTAADLTGGALVGGGEAEVGHHLTAWQVVKWSSDLVNGSTGVLRPWITGRDSGWGNELSQVM